jgi:hypothetical protein
MRVIGRASLAVLPSFVLFVCAAGASAQEVIAPDASAAAPTALSGRVVAAGRCPVPIGGFEGGRGCADHPFETTLVIRAADTQQTVAIVPTATDGTFQVALSPGQYLLDPLLADGNPPATTSVAVALPDDTWVTIRVNGGAVARLP